MKRKTLSYLLALCLVFALTAELAPAWAVEENADVVFAAEGETIPAQDLRETDPEAETEKEEISAEEVSAADLSAENPGAETEKAAEPAEAVPVSLSGEVRAAAVPGAEPNAGSMTWASLQTALNAGGTVTLTNSVTSPEPDVCLTIPYGVTVTLDLNGYTLDRLPSDVQMVGHVFEINGTLILEDNNTSGTGKITGGGVYINGGSFIMNSGSISGHHSKYCGGAMYISENGSFTMNGGTITDNSSQQDGGGVYIHNGSFIMNNGIISGNHGVNGGGVYVYCGSFTMIGGEISGNTTGEGGGVYVDEEGAFVLQGGSITANHAASGGGIFADYGSQASISGGRVTGNTADSEGGGVLVDVYATFILSGEPRITGNTCGGAASNLYLDSSGSRQAVATITGRLTGAEIGVSVGREIGEDDFVFFTSGLSRYVSDLSMFFSDSARCIVDWSGNGTEAVLRQNRMTWNSLQTALNAGGTVILTENITADPTNTYLTVLAGVTVTLDLNGFTIDRALTEAIENGYVLWVEGDLTLTDSSVAQTGTITGGKNTTGGGVCVDCVYDEERTYVGSFTMTSGTISDNNGGGVDVHGGTFTMTGGTISGNSGGGVYVDNRGTFTMEGGEISGNSAEFCGGVYVGGSFTMDGGEISGNSAGWSGGGVYVGGTFKMTGGEISGNTASNYGGGVYMESKSFTMTGGKISGNTAGSGGGVYVGGTFKMTGGAISGNTANSSGGGVCVGSGTFTMTSGTISGNHAAGGGGVIANYGSQVSISEGRVTGNTASSEGGGVFLKGNNTFRISGATVIASNVQGGTITDGVLTGGVPQNVYLPNDIYIELTGALKSGASVGITTQTLPTANSPVRITDGLSERGRIGAFFSDRDEYFIDWSGSGDEAALYVRTPLSISAQPEDATGIDGGTVQFHVEAAGTRIAYQWQYKKPGGSWKNLSTFEGCKTDTLTVPVTTDRNGYKYRCVVSSDIDTLNSDAATLTVFGITAQPEDVTAIAGGTANFSVTARGSGVTYQWQYLKPGGSWTNCSSFTGYDTAVLTVPVTAARDGYQFRCRVTCQGTTIVSEPAVLSVISLLSQPEDVTGIAGGTVTFSAALSGSGLNYRWQYKKPSGDWTNCGSFAGYDTATMTVPVTQARNGYQFRCVITANGASYTTRAATLTVFAVTAQPESVSAADGESVNFSVAARGTGVAYQWQYKKPDGDWTNCSSFTGYDTDNMTVPATLARDGYQFRCRVTCQGTVITSSAATLTVRANISITEQPKDVTGIAGGTVNFHVGVSGSGARYQWQYKKPGGSWTNCGSFAGFDTDTLTVPVTTARNGYLFRCKVSGQGTTLTSDAAALTVFAITAQPEDVTGVSGKTVKFHVTADGAGLSWQWQYKKPNGDWTNLGSFTGWNTDTLTVPVTGTRNGYKYRCLVSCGETTIPSGEATLTVFALVSQSGNVTAAAGTEAVFRVTARGEGVSYQWEYMTPTGYWEDVTDLDGWNGDTLTVPVTAEDNGNLYRCRVTCQGVTINSRYMILTVPE